MRLDISKVITTLTGETCKKGGSEIWTLQAYLPDAILAFKEEGAMRKLLLAQKIATSKAKSIDIDVADLTLIKISIKEAQIFELAALNTLFNGQIEIYLESIKESK